jgi:hypothetical protein
MTLEQALRLVIGLAEENVIEPADADVDGGLARERKRQLRAIRRVDRLYRAIVDPRDDVVRA